MKAVIEGQNSLFLIPETAFEENQLMLWEMNFIKGHGTSMLSIKGLEKPEEKPEVVE